MLEGQGSAEAFFKGGAGGCHFFLPSFLLAVQMIMGGSSETPHLPTSISSPALVFHYGLALPNPPALAGVPSKQVSHYHTQQTASGETGIP